ncbi:hypothetical protein ACA910_004088 [Epithemia clementina (nom. ined.)]
MTTTTTTLAQERRIRKRRIEQQQQQQSQTVQYQPPGRGGLYDDDEEEELELMEQPPPRQRSAQNHSSQSVSENRNNAVTTSSSQRLPAGQRQQGRTLPRDHKVKEKNSTKNIYDQQKPRINSRPTLTKLQAAVVQPQVGLAAIPEACAAAVQTISWSKSSLVAANNAQATQQQQQQTTRTARLFLQRALAAYRDTARDWVPKWTGHDACLHVAQLKVQGAPLKAFLQQQRQAARQRYLDQTLGEEKARRLWQVWEHEAAAVAAARQRNHDEDDHHDHARSPASRGQGDPHDDDDDEEERELTLENDENHSNEADILPEDPPLDGASSTNAHLQPQRRKRPVIGDDDDVDDDQEGKELEFTGNQLESTPAQARVSPPVVSTQAKRRRIVPDDENENDQRNHDEDVHHDRARPPASRNHDEPRDDDNDEEEREPTLDNDENHSNEADALPEDPPLDGELVIGDKDDDEGEELEFTGNQLESTPAQARVSPPVVTTQAKRRRIVPDDENEDDHDDDEGEAEFEFQPMVVINHVNDYDGKKNAFDNDKNDDNRSDPGATAAVANLSTVSTSIGGDNKNDSERGDVPSPRDPTTTTTTTTNPKTDCANMKHNEEASLDNNSETPTLMPTQQLPTQTSIYAQDDNDCSVMSSSSEVPTLMPSQIPTQLLSENDDNDDGDSNHMQQPSQLLDNTQTTCHDQDEKNDGSVSSSSSEDPTLMPSQIPTQLSVGCDNNNQSQP